jgi:threonine dehydrogenase-like Zn-dependent dehydrogenase
MVGPAMVARTAKAAVLTGPRQIELRELPLPEIGPDDGLLRVEATGVCGADWAPYIGQRYGEFFDPPLVLGHEIVGRVERIGARAAERWGVREGDRVVLEEPLPCGTCEACCVGRYQMCAAWRYGSKSVNSPPGLWGGYAEYVYLDPRALLHRMSPDVPTEIAPLYVPISNGIYWVQEVGGAGIGSTLLIQGPGQHGLGCVVAAREGGVGCIVVTGLSADVDRLAVARELGAHHTIEVDAEDAVARMAEITGGRLADTVINVTEGAPDALAQALDLAGDRGTIVVVGTAHRPASGFVPDKIMNKELTIKGVRGRYGRSIRAAIPIIESGRYPLEKLCTHSFSIEQTEQALQTLGREGDPGAIHISVVNA